MMSFLLPEPKIFAGRIESNRINRINQSKDMMKRVANLRTLELGAERRGGKDPRPHHSGLNQMPVDPHRRT